MKLHAGMASVFHELAYVMADQIVRTELTRAIVAVCFFVIKYL